MATNEIWTAQLGRALVTGAVLLVGGSLVIAQVRNPVKPPDEPELPAAAPEEANPTQVPRAKSAEPNVKSKAKATQPADDPRDAARRPADVPARRPAESEASRSSRSAGATDRPAGHDDALDSDPRTARQGEKRRGVGIQFQAEATDGLTVSGIEEESIAAQAGLRSGDRIISVDGQSIANQRQFQAYVSGQYGRRVPVIIERDGRQYTVQLGMQRPAADGAWLGVYLSDQERDQAGALITHVYPSGPAARAGLRPGDIVLQINGEQIAGTPELIATVEALQPSDRAEFLVRRRQGEVTVPVVLGSRDSFVFYGEDDEYGGRSGNGEDDEFSRIPPYAMQLEHDRRMAEQHHRLEMELRKLQDEVRKLREALQARN